MEEDMAKVVMAVTISLIMLGVGVFAFYVVNSEIGFTERQTEYFAVSDPTVAKVCNLNYPIEGIVSVHQYDGYNWIAVSSSDYTTGAQSVTVLPSGMTG